MLAVALLCKLTSSVFPVILISIDLLDIFQQECLSVIGLNQALQILVVNFDTLHLLDLSVRDREHFTEIDARISMRCSLHLE